MTRVVFPRDVPVVVSSLYDREEIGFLHLWFQHQVDQPEGGVVIVVNGLNGTGRVLHRLRCEVTLADATHADLGPPAWVEVKPYRLGPLESGELRVALPRETRGLQQVTVTLRGEAESGEKTGVPKSLGPPEPGWAVNIGEV